MTMPEKNKQNDFFIISSFSHFIVSDGNRQIHPVLYHVYLIL